MNEIAEVLRAMASLAWPGIVIAVVWIFRPAVASIIESAKSREFSIEIGGQKLSMKEANEQQRLLIADLQSQISELSKKIENMGAAAIPFAVPQVATQSHALTEDKAEKVVSVLWVDDHPKNNSYFIEQFEKLGIKVDLALSTAEGVQKFRKKRYSVVLSDMGRYEDGAQNSDAGIDLLKAVRAEDKNVPFFIFCSRRAAEKYGRTAVELGANSVSSSPTELYSLLNFNAIKGHA